MCDTSKSNKLLDFESVCDDESADVKFFVYVQGKEA